MPDRDPMEELFHRSAQGMEQRPSLKGWHRLEQRLEANRQRTSRRHATQGWLRPWHYAAAAVALVLIMVVGFGSQLDGGQGTLAQAPESIEELEFVSGESKMVAATYKSIPEGDRHQVLTVRNSSIPRLMPAPRFR